MVGSAEDSLRSSGKRNRAINQGYPKSDSAADQAVGEGEVMLYKNPKRFFSYDYDGDGFQGWNTAKEAKADAEKALEAYRDEAGSEGWPEDIETLVLWGEIKEIPIVVNRETRADYDADDEEWPYSDAFEEVFDMQLKPIEREEN